MAARGWWRRYDACPWNCNNLFVGLAGMWTLASRLWASLLLHRCHCRRFPTELFAIPLGRRDPISAADFATQARRRPGVGGRGIGLGSGGASAGRCLGHARRPVDTSLKERQWRDLNRLGRSLRYCSPATFDVLLLRALNERNWQAPPRASSLATASRFSSLVPSAAGGATTRACVRCCWLR